MRILSYTLRYIHKEFQTFMSTLVNLLLSVLTWKRLLPDCDFFISSLKLRCRAKSPSSLASLPEDIIRPSSSFSWYSSRHLAIRRLPVLLKSTIILFKMLYTIESFHSLEIHLMWKKQKQKKQDLTCQVWTSKRWARFVFPLRPTWLFLVLFSAAGWGDWQQGPAVKNAK